MGTATEDGKFYQIYEIEVDYQDSDSLENNSVEFATSSLFCEFDLTSRMFK